MSPSGKFLLILTLFYIQVKAYQIPRFTDLMKNQSFHDKQILIAMMHSGAVTENQSFVYAICDDVHRNSREFNCIVNVEAPAFYNATHKDTCIVNIKTEKPDQEFVIYMLLHAFGDDKVILSWPVADSDFKTIRYTVRIISMNTCQHQEVTFPLDLIGVAPNGNNFEIFVKDKTYCGSGDRCRISFDSNGKKLTDPVPFLSNIEASFTSLPISAYPRQTSKEFFVLAVNKTNMNSSKILYVNAEGKGIDLLTVENTTTFSMSSSHDAFTFCYAKEQTNITCQLFDLKISLKLKVFFEFVDEPVGENDIVRWLQPHNLQDGGFLLVTGATDPKSQRLESFSVIKVNPNGQKERPLVIEGLDFECLTLQYFYVSVSENDDDEVCFHFICEQRLHKEDGQINSLKFSVKCFPKKFISLRHTSSIN